MSEEKITTSDNSEKKKISLQDAIQQKLNQKRQEQSNKNNIKGPVQNGPKMRSQQTKKSNNQRRRTGV